MLVWAHACGLFRVAARHVLLLPGFVAHAGAGQGSMQLIAAPLLECRCQWRSGGRGVLLLFASMLPSCVLGSQGADPCRFAKPASKA